MNNKKIERDASYISSSVIDKTLLSEDVINHALDNISNAAYDLRNVPFSFSRGNMFEFLEGAKVEFKNAQLGNTLDVSPVNASREINDRFNEVSDVSFINQDDELINAQLKASRDPDFLIDQFTRDEYMNVERWCPSDMYEPVRNKLLEKLNDGTITSKEVDVLNNLVRTKTSNQEIDSLQGANGKLSLDKVESYVEEQKNQIYLENSLKSTVAITLTSALTGCVISSFKNINKYYHNEQDANTTLKNIGKDTISATGRGLVTGTIAGSLKYIGYQTGSSFLSSGVNSLIITNGLIDVGKSVNYYLQGRLSSNGLFTNIICASAMTLGSFLVNIVFPESALLRLGSIILLNHIEQGFLVAPAGKNEIIESNRKEILIKIDEELNREFNELNIIAANDDVFFKQLHCLFSKENSSKAHDELIAVCNRLGRPDLINFKEDFLAKVKRGEKIIIDFKK